MGWAIWAAVTTIIWLRILVGEHEASRPLWPSTITSGGGAVGWRLTLIPDPRTRPPVLVAEKADAASFARGMRALAAVNLDSRDTQTVHSSPVVLARAFRMVGESR